LNFSKVMLLIEIFKKFSETPWQIKQGVL
jgi:hypothetical protein